MTRWNLGSPPSSAWPTPSGLTPKSSWRGTSRPWSPRSRSWQRSSPHHRPPKRPLQAQHRRQHMGFDFDGDEVAREYQEYQERTANWSPAAKLAYERESLQKMLWTFRPSASLQRLL